jgi:hypothetical protein
VCGLSWISRGGVLCARENYFAFWAILVFWGLLFGLVCFGLGLVKVGGLFEFGGCSLVRATLVGS